LSDAIFQSLVKVSNAGSFAGRLKIPEITSEWTSYLKRYAIRAISGFTSLRAEI
jgi:hypothetical protein